MRALGLARSGERLRLLCLGAHADDIEIGAGATVLGLIAAGVAIEAHWIVVSTPGDRAAEAEASARAFLAGAAMARIELGHFRDSYFPAETRDIKDWLKETAARSQPDLILTHHRDDAHQDHRVVAELTGNLFRDHLTLAYEIPKWDGDLGRPNVYLPAKEDVMARKIELLMTHFGSQRAKDWFDEETFRGLARIRGMECRAPERYAEAFHGSKLMIA